MIPRAAALGAASGALYWMGLPGHAGWGCAVLSFAPLAAAAARGPRVGAVAGAAMGIVASAASLAFLPRVLVARADVQPGLAWAALLAAVVATAAPFAAMVAGAAWLARRGVPVALGMGALHVLVEAHAWRPLSWSIAASLVDAPLAGAWLGLVGAPLVGGAAGALGASIGAAASGRRAWPLVGAALAVAVAWGVARGRSVAVTGPHVVVAAIQPGEAEGGPEARDHARWARHLELSRQAAARGATLIVGAEGVVPGVVEPSVAVKAAGTLPATVVVGAVLRDGERVHNSALVLDRGQVIGRHDKRALVPLSDRAQACIEEALGKLAIDPGEADGAVETPAGRVGVAICYEELVDGALDRAMEDGAELLLTLSHDEWLAGTDVPERQIAHARLRAMERERWLVRASTTGPSALIDPTGRIVAITPRGASTALVGEAARATHRPLATSLRAAWAAVPWAALLFGLAAGEYRRRRAVQSTGDEAEKLTGSVPHGTPPGRFRQEADPGEATGGRT
ncbi:MAG: hypothetical protein IT374_06685 [Polyangiaceae bacterium]|nr:hypothetical protein [Polyangiaceae bacterium]